MLLNDFFELTLLKAEDKLIKATILLNKEHSIYEGHFPGQPIVPGVCIIQMLKEILELSFSQKLLLSEAKQIKFLKMINPEENQVMNAEIKWSFSEQIYSVEANFSVDDQISLKFQGNFKLIEMI